MAGNIVSPSLSSHLILSSPSMAADFDLEALVDLEQTFYETGYDDGFAHGRIHGLIEGRALGRAKGFEMWEELGFYEGFAQMWLSIYEKQGRSDDRATSHTRRLLDLIAQFPRSNPSETDETDFPKLFRQIRSRYKVLCSTLGVRPSLRYSDRSQDRDEAADATLAGPDKPTSEKSVWKTEKGAGANAPRAVSGHSFDF
ncbi:hypothetical protein D9615_001011 [Tricholomella constricta]|uniref:Essential protein Yae1 N-terminal domain-containing protein n=1 Tax=Tricholomella constricta TaxID=117010 RepID=A0A8H5HL56_9AGAR|nr:hypothetical protein D9615_001011 [Tricholomella constricta]